MDKVVIDTSAWIEAFRPKGDPLIAETVKGLIKSGRVLVPGIIKAELLRGTKTRAEFDHLKSLLEALLPLPMPESFWDDLAAFTFDLLRQGLTLPLVDCAIALLCIQNNAALLHRDHHFDLIAGVSGLSIFGTVRLSDQGLAKLNEARASGTGTFPDGLVNEMKDAGTDSEQ